MKRIVIIGSGGAGKSTLAKRLGEILSIEVIHLDKLYWQPNWVEPKKDEWHERVAEILKKESWIVDGNFGGTMEMRLDACDTVIFLDLPRTLCLYRVLRRRLKYRGTNRPDMTVGCNEKIDFEFIDWIWNYPKRKRPGVIEKLKSVEKHAKVIQLKSSKEVEKFVLKLSKMQ